MPVRVVGLCGRCLWGVITPSSDAHLTSATRGIVEGPLKAGSPSWKAPLLYVRTYENS